MRTVQTVFSWLPPTQSWLRRLILAAPDPTVVALIRDGTAGPPTRKDTWNPLGPAAPAHRSLVLADHLPALATLGAAYHKAVGSPWAKRGDRRLRQMYARLLAAAVDRLAAADLIHAHFGDQGYRARNVRLPLVVSFYGYDYGLARDAFWAQAYLETFAKAAVVLAEAPGAADRLIALGCPPHKARVHPIAVDLAELPFRPRFPHDPLELLFVGRFEEKKGLPDALEAVARAGPGFHLTAVGDGPQAAACKALACRLNLHVAWRGALSHAQTCQALQEADLLLAPSRTAKTGDTEGGLPVVVIEALAAGLPVLATRHADIPWAVQDGLCGALVPEGDPAAIAAALHRLAAHPERWPVMGALGRSRVAHRHDARLQAGRLRTLYEEALALARSLS